MASRRLPLRLWLAYWRPLQREAAAGPGGPARSTPLTRRSLVRRIYLFLAFGIAVLMITHDLMLLDSAADLIFAMKCGRLVASGAPEAVLTEGVLGEVYDAPVRTMRSDGRTFIWSEL